MRRLSTLGALLFCASSPLLAQQAETGAAPGSIKEAADRIARELWPTEVTTFTIDEQGRPRFRSGVTETLPPPPWQPTAETTLTPAGGAISHQEMLRVMTPQAFSTPPLISGSVDPGAAYNELKKAWREWQARRVRARIEKELEQLRAASDSDSN
jgi:hypothetical protein